MNQQSAILSGGYSPWQAPLAALFSGISAAAQPGGWSNFGQGVQQGQQNFQQGQQQQQMMDLRRMQIEQAEAEARRANQEREEAQAIRERLKSGLLGGPASPTPTQAHGNYGAATGGIQTASGAPGQGLAAMFGGDPQRAAIFNMMVESDPHRALQFIGEQAFAEPAAPEAPKTVGGLMWDGDSFEPIPGYTEQQAAIAAAGRSAMPPPTTNLVTLVAPGGKTTRSFDSRDPQVQKLAGEGWIERQTSMFPAAPTGYTYTPSGLAPIPGGPADPANPNNITGDQRKTGSFATRLEAATTIIDQYETAGTDYVQQGLGYLPFIGNELKSSDRQQLEQAQRDFINAQLRRESGATIQDQEFENARQQYFPQPGDSEEVIQQKRMARAIAVENMKREAGPALAKPADADDGWTTLPSGVRIRRKN